MVPAPTGGPYTSLLLNSRAAHPLQLGQATMQLITSLGSATTTLASRCPSPCPRAAPLMPMARGVAALPGQVAWVSARQQVQSSGAPSHGWREEGAEQAVPVQAAWALEKDQTSQCPMQAPAGLGAPSCISDSSHAGVGMERHPHARNISIDGLHHGPGVHGGGQPALHPCQLQARCCR